MKGFSTLLLGLVGFILAPYAVALIEDFIGSDFTWLPFVITLLLAGVIYAVGVLRGVALGMLAGVVAYGAFLQFTDKIYRFLPTGVPEPF